MGNTPADQVHDSGGSDDDFVQSGDWGEVRYAKRSNGSMEAKEWLEAQADKLQSRFDHLFRRIAAVGRINNTEQFRMLDEGVWEFKRDGHRILAFQYGNCWRLTHHFFKGSRKCPAAEIARAKVIRNECLERMTTE